MIRFIYSLTLSFFHVQAKAEQEMQRAQDLGDRLEEMKRRHATSQLHETTLKNVHGSGPGLLHDCLAAFRDASFLRSSRLAVQFRAESGFGSGVTVGGALKGTGLSLSPAR